MYENIKIIFHYFERKKEVLKIESSSCDAICKR
jgi:hypothetical protein